jgi:predicted metal-dependent phosphoesterase TrpH
MRMMRVDMHLHTHGSFDCTSQPDAVLAAARDRGIDVICITDHDNMAVALEMQARHPLAVIAGEEVKTAEGVDIIGLFLREPIEKGTPALETCRLIREQGGLVYVPHPFAAGKGRGGRILPVIEASIDALEGFNARLHDERRNTRALTWAAERGIPVGAGSDAHTLGEVGRAYVEIAECALEPAAFLAALHGARIHGRTSARLVHVASTWAKLRKRIGGR